MTSRTSSLSRVTQVTDHLGAGDRESPPGLSLLVECAVTPGRHLPSGHARDRAGSSSTGSGCMDQFVRSDDDGARRANKNAVRRSGHLPFRLTAASAVHLSVTTLLQDAVQGDEVGYLAPAGDGREAGSGRVGSSGVTSQRHSRRLRAGTSAFKPFVCSGRRRAGPDLRADRCGQPPPEPF